MNVYEEYEDYEEEGEGVFELEPDEWVDEVDDDDDDSEIRQPSDEEFEQQLRSFCSRFWGRGDQGWTELVKRHTMDVPPPNPFNRTRDDFYDETHEDEGGKGVEYSSMSLADKNFDTLLLSGCKELLVRDEYKSMVKYLERMDGAGRKGVVLLGSRGVGKKSEISLDRVDQDSLQANPPFSRTCW